MNIWRAFLSELNERQRMKWSELLGGNQPDAMFLAQSLVEFAAIVG